MGVVRLCEKSVAWSGGPSCRFREEHEPASDIDTALVDSLKVLDPDGPIREADIEASIATLSNTAGTRNRTLS